MGAELVTSPLGSTVKHCITKALRGEGAQTQAHHAACEQCYNSVTKPFWELGRTQDPNITSEQNLALLPDGNSESPGKAPDVASKVMLLQ